jgi:hypothetical protein
MAGYNRIEEISFGSEILAGKHIPDLQGVPGCNRKAEIHHLHMNDGFRIGKIDVGQCEFVAGQMPEKGLG